MPKSAKKKKDKAADFTKAKLKLGKGKQTPTNAVDTSFKARSIALPSQSIAVDKGGDAPSTKRRLTFDDLIAHLKHYNANTRRDAIHGLRELFEAHPELIIVHLTALVNSSVRLIGDEDASVRKVLLSFFSWLFRQVPPDDLIPHSPVLLLFTTSAQTHIFPEIRIDAVRFLDVYLEYIPDVVTKGWMYLGGVHHGRRVLEGYLGILNAGTTFGEGADSGPVKATSTASVILSTPSKLILLRSLASFFTHAITSPWNPSEKSESDVVAPSTPTWYLSSSFATTSAFDAFNSLLHSSTASHTPSPSASSVNTRHWIQVISDETKEEFIGQFSLAAAPCSTSWSLNDLSDVETSLPASWEEGKAGTAVDATVACVTQLARTMHPTLVSTFLDCAPNVFSPSSSPSETELQLVLVVCRICRSLYGRILQDSAESGYMHETAEADLQTILSYFYPYFPFTVADTHTAKREIKIEQAFQDLNLIFCELSSFLVLASQRNKGRPPLVQKKAPSRHGRANHLGVPHTSTPAAQVHQIERVGTYVVQLLRGQTPPSGPKTSLPRPITPQAYTALLPTIWSLINNQAPGAPDVPTATFTAVVEHGIKALSTSAVKRHTIDFIGRLVLLDREPEYMGTFRVGRSQEQVVKLEEWLLQLPKTLWELGSSHLETSETIVRLLLRSCQRRSRFTPTTYAGLRSRLVPYFVISHPTRGQLPGPYAKLPPGASLRRLVLDLVATIAVHGQSSSTTTTADDMLLFAVGEAVGSTPEAAYWTGVSGRV